MRVGLYGGCFNPVHAGHLAAARSAREALGLDHVLFIPSGNPPLKGNAGLASGADRLAMIMRAIAGEAGMAVSRIEIDRDGSSFSVDTVRSLRVTYPADAELFFLLGDDCVDRLPRWKGIEELHAMVRFAILPRLGLPAAGHDSRLLWLPLAPIAVSSTAIRTMVAAGEVPSAELVPAAVGAYITAQGLYAEAPERAACA